MVIYSVSSFPGNVFDRKRLTSQSSINNSVHETSDDEVEFLSKYLTRIVIISGVVREERFTKNLKKRNLIGVLFGRDPLLQ